MTPVDDGANAVPSGALAFPQKERSPFGEDVLLRRCAVTRERLLKEEMIRFVIGPNDEATPDLAARLPGRGIWLKATADVEAEAEVPSFETSSSNNNSNTA